MVKAKQERWLEMLARECKLYKEYTGKDLKKIYLTTPLAKILLHPVMPQVATLDSPNYIMGLEVEIMPGTGYAYEVRPEEKGGDL